MGGHATRTGVKSEQLPEDGCPGMSFRDKAGITDKGRIHTRLHGHRNTGEGSCVPVDAKLPGKKRKRWQEVRYQTET